MSKPYSKPLPQITPLDRPFWEHARRSELTVQQCDDCGDRHIPASPVCPNCLGSAQSWNPVSGRGTLESWIDFHRAYWEGFSEELPYRVCLVKLEEGPLLVSNLVSGGDELAIGAPVHVVFDKVTEDITLPKFALG